MIGHGQHEQLQLDLELAQLHALVAESGMTDEEIAAAVEDARRRLAAGPLGASQAPPCVCENGSLLLVGALAVDRVCARCGREPRA